MPLKGEDGGRALNNHGNYIVDHGKSWINHGIVFLNFCGNPEIRGLEPVKFTIIFCLQYVTIVIVMRNVLHVLS